MEFDFDDQYKGVLDRILDLMRDTFGDRFAAYYDSDPIQIPTVNMPCIVVEKSNGNATIQDAPTGHDTTDGEYVIKVIFNKQDDYGANDDEDLTGKKLRYIVEARDMATGTWKQGTVVYALRQHFTLDQELYENDITWQYGIQGREDAILTSEAHVLVRTRGKVQVINRD